MGYSRRSRSARRHGCAILLAACLAWAAAAGAQQFQARTLELSALTVQPPTGYVNDRADLLPRAQEQELEELCRRIDRETGAQIVVAILPDLAGEEASDVKVRLFEAWGVGRRGDDRGILLLHAVAERRVEVEVGYDLEPILPDGLVGQLLDEHVVPNFRAERYYAGYQAAILSFGRAIAGDAGARSGSDAYGTGAGRARGEGFPWIGLLILPIMIYLFIRHPRLMVLLLLMNMGGRGGSQGGSMGGGFGGGFGGFGGGRSGGGGAGRSY